MATLEAKLASNGEGVSIVGWLFTTLLWFLCLPFYVVSRIRIYRKLREEQEQAELKPYLDEIESYLKKG